MFKLVMDHTGRQGALAHDEEAWSAIYLQLFATDWSTCKLSAPTHMCVQGALTILLFTFPTMSMFQLNQI